MTDKTETPLTDGAEFYGYIEDAVRTIKVRVVTSDFARQLERTLRERGHALPTVLFDGYRVFEALSDKAKRRTSPENVADVLDAVVKLARIDAALPQPESRDEGGKGQ